MKKILILGANPETASLVKKAKELGLYTIVTDYDAYAYAKTMADQAENVDAVDVDGLVDLAKREKVSGVVVGVAEALLPVYSEVCKRLNLPCYSSLDKFELLVRKDLFKQKCREFGVPTIKQYELDQVDSIEFPVIVKPVDSCSSKGIRICNNLEELNSAVSYALEFSKVGKVLIEEYLSGDEVISYYVMQDGNPIFVGMCDRYTYKSKRELVQLPTSYIFPSRYIDSYLKHTDRAIKAMIRGMGLNNGSIFFQCIADKEGIVRVYEPGYRLNGAQEHLLISEVSGIDAKELYINYALTGKVSSIDLEPLANPKPSEYLCKLSPLVKPGTIKTLDGLEEISKLPGVVSVNPSYRVHDTVSGEGTLKQIVSRFFIVVKSKAELINTIDKIHKLLIVEDEKGDNMIIGKFNTELINQYYK